MEFSQHMRAVVRFMAKQDFELGVDLHTLPANPDVVNALNHVSSEMYKMARLLEKMLEFGCNDPRIMRTQLHVEETAEMVEGLAKQSKIDLIDSLADIQFITMGTAVTFDMHLEAAHQEVCRSNLTKNVRIPNVNPRCRDKGQHYDPPKLARLVGYCQTCELYPALEGCTRCDKCLAVFGKE